MTIFFLFLILISVKLRFSTKLELFNDSLVATFINIANILSTRANIVGRNTAIDIIIRFISGTDATSLSSYDTQSISY